MTSEPARGLRPPAAPPPPPATPAEAPPPGDASYAEAYAAGYGEGVRDSLREVLTHAARGHTTAEIRILVESRIARIPEEVELKRRSLTQPPRRPAWGALLRAPGPVPPAPAAAPTAGPAAPPAPFAPGTAYLFREEQPREGIRFAREVAGRHGRILWVSPERPPDLGLPADRISFLPPRARPATGEEGGGPGEIAGRIRSSPADDGAVLAYVDALEYFATEFGAETTVRFATWLASWARETGATVVVSLDPKSLPEREFSRLQRAFGVLR